MSNMSIDLIHHTNKRNKRKRVYVQDKLTSIDDSKITDKHQLSEGVHQLMLNIPGLPQDARG